MKEIHEVRLTSMLPLEIPDRLDRVAQPGGTIVLTAVITIHSIETEKVDITEHHGALKFLDGPTTLNAVAASWSAL